MKKYEFSPRESVERSLARWWIVVLVTVLGGIAGWVFHFFQPPVYEATATVTVTMDFHKWDLTQYEEDYAFNAAGDIINSIPVKDQIIAEARARGLPIDIYQLQRQMVLERKQSVWELHVRDREPKVATELANIWEDKGVEALNLALEHALQADVLEYQVFGIARNLSTKNSINDLMQERRLSGGIISIMTFALTETASVPEKPVLYTLGTLVLAGACIGFFISLWVVNSYKVQHRD